MTGSLAIPSIVLASGNTLRSQLKGEISAATLIETVAGSSTLSLTVQDRTRAVLNQPLLAGTPTVVVGGRSYTLAQLQTSQDSISLTFQDSLVSRLQGETGALLAATGVQTRTDFARQLVLAAGGRFYGQGDELLPGSTLRGKVVSTGQIGRGTSGDTTEDSWTCLQRLAQEITWRCFSDGSIVWFGSDAWLLANGGTALEVSERTRQIGYVTGEWTPAKTSDNTASFTVTGPYQARPGQPVNLVGLGPISGQWMLQEITADAAKSSRDITLCKAQADVADNEDTSTIDTTGVDTSGNPIQLGAGTTATGKAAVVVSTAISKLGCTYVYAAAGPSTFDCSGLAQYCWAKAGVAIPRTTLTQWPALPKVPAGTEQPGDLVYFEPGAGGLPGHVGIYVGDNRMIDAPHTGTVVRYDTVNTWPGFMGVRRPA